MVEAPMIAPASASDSDASHPSPPRADNATTARNTASHNKLGRKLRRLVGGAVADYAMIEAGDRIMACLSGGKDSYTMLDMLLSLRRNAPVEFDVVAVNLDQKQPNFPADVLPGYLARLGVDHHIVEEDTYSVVKRLTPPGKTYCPLCSRLRRGVLYSFATRIGATKIALGHHADDAVETLFLNMFHGGRMKAMPPKLVSDDGRHVVIRPLSYVRERDIERWSRYQGHPIIPCDLCGSQENLQRQAIKAMLRTWDGATPGRVDNIARSLRHVTPSHLADPRLMDFQSLRRRVEALPSIDIQAP